MNISRLLSKVSLDFNCADQLVNHQKTGLFLTMMNKYKENSAVLIRIAFVLGNLTTHYQTARQELCKKEESFKHIMSMAQFYLDKDLNGHTPK